MGPAWETDPLGAASAGGATQTPTPAEKAPSPPLRRGCEAAFPAGVGVGVAPPPETAPNGPAPQAGPIEGLGNPGAGHVDLAAILQQLARLAAHQQPLDPLGAQPGTQRPQQQPQPQSRPIKVASLSFTTPNCGMSVPKPASTEEPGVSYVDSDALLARYLLYLVLRRDWQTTSSVLLPRRRNTNCILAFTRPTIFRIHTLHKRHFLRKPTISEDLIDTFS